MKVLFLLTVIFFSTNGFAQKSKNEHEWSTEFKELNDLILIDSKQAHEKIKELEKKFSISGNKTKGEELALSKIDYYRSLGDFPNMKYELYDALEKVSSSTPLRVKIGLDYFKAVNYGYDGDKIKMFSLLKKVLLEAKKNNFNYLEAQCLSSFGKYYVGIEDYKKSQEYFNQAGIKYLSIGDTLSKSIVEMNQGIAYYYQGETHKAFTLFHKLLEFNRKNRLKKSYCQSLSNLAEAHLYENQLDSANYYFRQFLKIKNQADIRDVYQVYSQMEYLFKLKKNIDSAYHYSKLTMEVDEMIQQKMDKELSNEIELDYRQKINQKIINQKNQAFQKQIDENWKLWIEFLLIGGVLLLFLLKVLISNRQKNQLNAELIIQKQAVLDKNEIIDTALKEKELLLKEIHHRVKNNLQIISSLMNMQSKSITDKRAMQVLMDGKERIQAIALIHNKLYQKEVLSYIVMDDYLPDLIYQLKKTYARDECEIEIKIVCVEIKLSMDAALPVGLIVCELVTNSLKHAFNGLMSGKINIEFKQSTFDNSFEIQIEDNGNGLPKELNFPHEGSLGAEIITALTEQLNGQFSIDSSDSGMKFILKFQDFKLQN